MGAHRAHVVLLLLLLLLLHLLLLPFFSCVSLVAFILIVSMCESDTSDSGRLLSLSSYRARVNKFVDAD